MTVASPTQTRLANPFAPVIHFEAARSTLRAHLVVAHPGPDPLSTEPSSLDLLAFNIYVNDRSETELTHIARELGAAGFRVLATHRSDGSGPLSETSVAPTDDPQNVERWMVLCQRPLLLAQEGGHHASPLMACFLSHDLSGCPQNTRLWTSWLFSTQTAAFTSAELVMAHEALLAPHHDSHLPLQQVISMLFERTTSPVALKGIFGYCPRAPLSEIYDVITTASREPHRPPSPRAPLPSRLLGLPALLAVPGLSSELMALWFVSGIPHFPEEEVRRTLAAAFISDHLDLKPSLRPDFEAFVESIVS